MHVQYGLALWQRGDLAGFNVHLGRARQRAERLPRPDGPFNLAYALTYEAWVQTEVGDYDRALASTEELLEIAGRYGFDFWTLAGTTADAVTRGRMSLASGSADPTLLLEQAGRLVGTSMMIQMIDSKLLLPYGLTAQGDFVASTGDHDQALGLFDEALAVADATGSKFYRAETHRLRARTRAALGDPNAADDLRLAIELAHRQGSIPFELRARLDAAELGERSSRLDELCADVGFVAASGAGRHDLSTPTT
jgi:tetratricopeptide (TPR) repeat protein